MLANRIKSAAFLTTINQSVKQSININKSISQSTNQYQGLNQDMSGNNLLSFFLRKNT